MQEQKDRDRKTIWALIIGGLGVVVAIVALVIAISAMSATNDDAEITKAVKQEANEQIGGLRADLQKNITAATAVLQRLEAGSSQADRARAALREEASANRSGVASNQASIKALQTSVANLNKQVTGLSDSVTTLTRNQQTLTQQVKAIEKTIAAVPKSG
jgi:chromosome segregation ATPase